ncbi:hypothetical protein BT93_L1534 [Corymbia citriodora subsp. variegata]|uniref:Uncharacterized protein n=1 Tax=Corymbia citriodora subsp. variegata TaxID=360336 RepID=A0A8T0CMH7_CORYI|nr:hypothetical protein BT93_L1534 [Corymbia citriodora subsp. variegata]
MSRVCRQHFASVSSDSTHANSCRRLRQIGFPLFCSVFPVNRSKYSKLIRSSFAGLIFNTNASTTFGLITIRSQPLHIQRMSEPECILRFLEWFSREGEESSFMVQSHS